jgi:hypothetical protein
MIGLWQGLKGIQSEMENRFTDHELFGIKFSCFCYSLRGMEPQIVSVTTLFSNGTNQ